MLAARIAQLMELHDLQQKEFGHRCGVPQKTVSSLVTGARSNPRMSTLLKIAEGMDVSLDWLATGQKRTPEELTPDEQFLVERFRSLDAKDKVVAVGIMKAMAPILAPEEAPDEES